VAKLEWRTDYHMKTMVIAFVNGTGKYFLLVLPRSQSMHTSYFAGETMSGLEDSCDPEGRNPDPRKVTFHFNNAPIRNTRTVMRQLVQLRFKRMEHRPYSPDLTRATSFLLVV
jgi:hypothetical protein